MTQSPCPLCQPDRETLLWQGRQARVVLVEDSPYAGYCRVIWQTHVAEMTDLSADDRRQLMDIVFAVEATLRRALLPTKINLASLGNQVAHLHWHVIPRQADDATFPDAIWAAPRREQPPRTLDLGTLRQAMAAAIDAIHQAP